MSNNIYRFYTWRNPLTNKVFYCGRTQKEILERARVEARAAFQQFRKNGDACIAYYYDLSIEIRKYVNSPKEALDFFIIEEFMNFEAPVETDEVLDRYDQGERDLIYLFNTYKHGYLAEGCNMTEGGQFTTSQVALDKERERREKWEAFYGKPYVDQYDENNKHRKERILYGYLKTRKKWLCDEWLEHSYGWQRFYWECAVNIPEEWCDKRGVSILPIDETKPLSKDNYKIERAGNGIEAMKKSHARRKKEKKARFKEEMGFDYYPKSEALATWDFLRLHLSRKFGDLCPLEWLTGKYRLSYFIRDVGQKPGKPKEYTLMYKKGFFYWDKPDRTGDNSSYRKGKKKKLKLLIEEPLTEKSLPKEASAA